MVTLDEFLAARPELGEDEFNELDGDRVLSADDLLPADMDGNGGIDAVDIQKVVLYILKAT